MNNRIKELAEQAGMTYFKYISEESMKQAERFAELVRQDEREACAKLCDDLSVDYATAERCADSIRGRTE